jgi:lysozyme
MQNKKAGAAGIVCSVAAIIAIVLGNGHVRTNERGLELIGNAESCRRDPYVCPAGVLTDGMGNTHGVKPGTVKNDQQIAAEWENTSMLNPVLTGTPTAEICLMILSAL